MTEDNIYALLADCQKELGKVDTAEAARLWGRIEQYLEKSFREARNYSESAPIPSADVTENGR